MRIAYFAQVKTDSKNGGPPRITNWVAKQRYRDSFAQIKPHATNARMYEACGHLLQEYQHVIDQCTSNLLTTELKQKASAFELVCHCVIFTGDQGSPTDVYFLESALNGHYVKYCSNVNFAVTSDQDGMDVQNLWIMDAFSHWSFADSNGERLICDLQGVGSTLTNPQIIDVDKKRWANGNNSKKGIQEFILQHRCNTICHALNLLPPNRVFNNANHHTQSATVPASTNSNIAIVPQLQTCPNEEAARNALSLSNILSSERQILPHIDYFRSELNHPTSVHNPESTRDR
ncbi:hypothetical protein PCASD_13920 [Puccinia coronata f. sp. avenae]|uniref:Alpha-type protein kinase domain-containing protein n=1 Tax=Puccinia coronata f. sp. avenae TaxID=200324 RepID=A0A2N5UHA7_9BASI|nr:hypothetical protein PCASD_13920 [Puccinia coronata f. sp. avenae]